jgi:hypothetical protein
MNSANSTGEWLTSCIIYEEIRWQILSTSVNLVFIFSLVKDILLLLSYYYLLFVHKFYLFQIYWYFWKLKKKCC